MLTTPPTPEEVEPGKPPGWIGWLLLSPILVWLVMLVIAPTVILIAYSLARDVGIAEVEWKLSLGGYEQLTGAVALRTLWRSLWLAGMTTVLCLLAGYPVAYFIGKAPPRWRNALLVLVMIPFWISFLVRIYAWTIILRQEGLLNAALGSLHVGPANLIYNTAGELIGLVYTFLPFMILPIYGSVEKLDDSLIEAALDLGASPMHAFRTVILPLTRPGIVAGIMLVFIPAIGMFAVSDLLGGKRIPLIGNLIEQQFVGKSGNWPFGAAMGVALLVIFVVCYLVLGARRLSGR